MWINHIKPASDWKWNSTSPYFMTAGGRRAFTESASTSSGWPKAFPSARRSAPSGTDPNRPQPRKSRKYTIGTLALVVTERMIGTHRGGCPDVSSWPEGDVSTRPLSRRLTGCERTRCAQAETYSYDPKATSRLGFYVLLSPSPRFRKSIRALQTPRRVHSICLISASLITRAQ